MSVLLGCIADDFTGGTDLAGMLVKAGMRTVQMIGVPHEPIGDDVDAVVIALKSRTTPAETAVAESLAALYWLQQAGCRQFYFKYCSTFDSTEQGNIGPVAEALMEELGSGRRTRLEGDHHRVNVVTDRFLRNADHLHRTHAGLDQHSGQIGPPGEIVSDAA